MSIQMRFGYASLIIGCGSQPEWGHKRERGGGHKRGHGSIRGFTKITTQPSLEGISINLISASETLSLLDILFICESGI